MITQDIAQDKLLEIVQKNEFVFNKWIGKEFADLKLASTTEKGNIAEDFLVAILRACDYKDVDSVRGRKGQHDVSFKHNGKKILFEVKMATRDTSNNFQFNGIRYDTRYTHLFCLGISPDKIGYLIVSKKEVVGDNYRLVPMARGSNSSFKLTRPERVLKTFGNFQMEIDNL